MNLAPAPEGDLVCPHCAYQLHPVPAGPAEAGPPAVRPRRSVSGWRWWAIRPLFRYSYTRDAYVLHLVGRRLGPVLRPW